MYGRSSIEHGQTIPLGASGFYENERNTPVPYNNDRLDDAVSVDYSQALGADQTPRLASGVYASRIVQNSVKSQNDRPLHSSGQYEARIGNLRQTTSTPDPISQRRNSGGYADRILGNSLADDDERGPLGRNLNPLGLGRTVHNTYFNQSFRNKQDSYPPPIPEDDIRVEGLESPRSIQWPETARSYPVGFEASHIAHSVPYIPPTGESSDQGSLDRKKNKPKRTGSKKNKDDEDMIIELETPPWADRLLTKESSLLGKFRNMRSAINKWTIRRKSRWVRGSDRSAMDLFYSPKRTKTEGTSNLLAIENRKSKTNNVATFLCGLSLMVLCVFPVILMLVIFSDPSDLAQISIRMSFNGSVDANFDDVKMTYYICNQIDTAFSSLNSFQSCDVTYSNGSILADILLIFNVNNFPSNETTVKTIDSHFKNAIALNKYAYKQNSVTVKNYNFIKSRLKEPSTYEKGQTTRNRAESTIPVTPIPTTIDVAETTKSVEAESTTVKTITSELEHTTLANVATSIFFETSSSSTTQQTKIATNTISTNVADTPSSNVPASDSEEQTVSTAPNSKTVTTLGSTTL